MKRRRRTYLHDPRSPRPRLADPASVPDDPYGPRTISQHIARQPPSPRLIAAITIALAAFGALAFNLFNLQVAEGKRFATLAEGNRVRQEVVAPPRGIIFDRHGYQLVTNQGSFAVAIVPIDLPTKQPARGKVLDLLQKGVGVVPPEVEREVALHQGDPFQPFILKRDLDVTQEEFIDVNLAAMPGVRKVTGTTRHYVNGSGLAHLLGYVGQLDKDEVIALKSKGYLYDDVIGRAGIEYSDENWLRGTPGKKVEETDAQGKAIKVISSTDPVPGNSVYLTLDWNLQQEVAKDLQAGMDSAHKQAGYEKRAQAGAGIVMNPQSGEIYSMVSLPDYDINLFAGGITQPQYDTLSNDPRLPLLNRSIDGLYPPGSTFKPVTGSAALQSGVINRNSNIFCPGFLQRGTFKYACWNTSGHGNQDIVDAIGHSCDVFFYTVADEMGDLTLNRFAKDFGVGRKTGIDLAPEARGFAPDRNWKKAYFAEAFQETHDKGWLDSTWYEGDTITYGIGQSFLLATPLQDLNWTATVANGGNYLRPQLTGRISAVDGSRTVPYSVIVDHKVQVAPEALAVIREGMRFSVTGGTSQLLKGLPAAAGKTGTAQYGFPDAKNNYPTHAWFTAYAPVTDPEVAIVVFIEGGGEGSSYSEPVANQILTYYFAHRDAIRAS